LNGKGKGFKSFPSFQKKPKSSLILDEVDDTPERFLRMVGVNTMLGLVENVKLGPTHNRRDHIEQMRGKYNWGRWVIVTPDDQSWRP
jgi:hypothetical protein